MRPLRAFATLLTSLLVVLGSVPAVADTAPSTVCTIDDDRLNEVSGLVATESGYAAINDGSDEVLDVRVYLLDKQCGVEDVTMFPREPNDPEDLARTPDGTLWIGDLGDNNRERTTAAIWMVRPNANQTTLYRLEYPDGAHDAEALIMTPNNTPIVVTKELSGTARIYQGTKPLSGDDATFKLKAAGTLELTATGTPGGDPSGGTVNQTVVTGAALSPDGKKVAVRTYTDAYEWDVPKNGDIAAAITGNAGRRTPLPNEPLGEAISYTSDSKNFITASEGVGQPLQQWTPAKAQGGDDDAESGGSKKSADSGSWYSDLTLDQVMYLVYGLGLLGLVLLGAGIYGIVRHRRRAKQGADDEPNPPRRGRGREEPRALPARHGNGLYGSPLPDRPARAPERRQLNPGRRRPEQGPRGTVYGGGSSI